MNKLKAWRKEADRIEKENKRLHDTGEFATDEFIITPSVPEPCKNCLYNLDNNCIMDMCYENDKFIRR